MLGTCIIEGMKKAEDEKAERFARNLVPGKHRADDTIGYVHLILAHHGKAPGKEYDEYRKRRLVMLRAYLLNMLKDTPGLKRAVGIAMDASSKVTGRVGGSEDFFALEVEKWTPELDEQAQELKEAFGLLKPGNVTHATHGADEFPRTLKDSPPTTVTTKPDAK